MDFKALRDVSGRAKALKTILAQGGIHGQELPITALADMIVELAEAVRSDNVIGPPDQANQRQLNLGEIIDLLEAWPKPEDACRFDFGDMEPVDLISYRGSYDQLAITYRDGVDYPNPTVIHVLEMLRAAVGKEFSGYKGGEYVMTAKTPVWIANYSRTSGTFITGCVADHHHFVFRTSYE